MGIFTRFKLLQLMGRVSVHPLFRPQRSPQMSPLEWEAAVVDLPAEANPEVGEELADLVRLLLARHLLLRHHRRQDHPLPLPHRCPFLVT
jgi:hypothetical protein